MIRFRTDFKAHVKKLSQDSEWGALSTKETLNEFTTLDDGEPTAQCGPLTGLTLYKHSKELVKGRVPEPLKHLS